MIVDNEPCPECRSRGRDKTGNHLMVFDDGGKHCKRCGHHVHSEGKHKHKAKVMRLKRPTDKVDVAELGHVDYRGIKSRYMKMYDYRVRCDETNGEPMAVYYPLHKDGKPVGHKVRNVTEKKFTIAGDGKGVDLIGMDVNGGKRLCLIVEGENDAAAAKQMIANGANWYDNVGRDYTVVSVPHGSNSKLNKHSYEWLLGFKTIKLATDMDKRGDELAHSINDMFAQGVCERVTMPVKDAHECLESGLEGDFIRAVTSSTKMIADGIVMGDEGYDELLTDYRKNPNGGIPYPPMFEALNQMLYGLRTGEVDLFTSGSGMGKSQMFKEMLHYLTNDRDLRTGVLMLEEDTSHTKIGQLSITANKLLHLPEVKAEVSDEEFKEYFQGTKLSNLVLYDHFGGLAEDSLTDKIRYMATAMGCQYIMLDHISIVISEFAAEGDERRMIDQLMTKMAKLAKELDIWIGVVSHLRKTNSGPSFEEGAVPSLDDLRGSGSLKQLSYQVVALSRNQQDPDPVKRNTTQVTVLKNRFCGRTGPAGRVYYDHDTGRMSKSTLTDEEWNDNGGIMKAKL